MPYKRIVSLVPSLSELLIDLGVKEWLVGRTKFCIHPQPAIQHIPVIGGTKNPNLEKIIALNPDLIVANKEENQKEDIEFLSEHTEVLVTEIGSISSALVQIKHIGKKLAVEANADKLISEINSELDSLKTYQEVSCVYFIWKDPWMS
ncbi:MAG: helical backbone metal receptor, partial [Balneolales bacterium]|nr:helical backbone metal receptor [Balneolales bacterium]